MSPCSSGVDLAQIEHAVVLGALEQDELGALQPAVALLGPGGGGLGLERIERFLAAGPQQAAQLLEQAEHGRLVHHVLASIASALVGPRRRADEGGVLEPREVVADPLPRELAVRVRILARPRRCQVDVIHGLRFVEFVDEPQPVHRR
jgi:hypothetical protein